MFTKQIAYNLFICTLLFPLLAFSETLEVNFLYIGPENDTALLGAKQGLDEANLQGQFLSQKYNLDSISSEQINNHDVSKYIAILTATDIKTFEFIAEKFSDMPVFNLNIEANDLRTKCINNALHTIQSKAMKSDAEQQWLSKEPGSNAIAQGWHRDFKKFAARDLNKRYKKSFDIAMDDKAWAGWAAVKMTSDAVARTQITESALMLNYLKTDLTFDGQKGSNMTFRETGQLRQLILLIENDKIVAEAPIRGIAKPPTLDSLGLLSCEK